LGLTIFFNGFCCKGSNVSLQIGFKSVGKVLAQNRKNVLYFGLVQWLPATDYRRTVVIAAQAYCVDTSCLI
jgi:hypothetical protein